MSRLFLCLDIFRYSGFVPPCYSLMAITATLGVGQRDRRNRFLFAYLNKQCLVMSKQANICLSENNSILQTTLPANDKAVLKDLFSWRTVANIYRLMSLGLEAEVTIEDAKGYTKVALLFIAALVMGGMVEGGAL